MTKSIYFHLAINNIKKNKNTFLPFALSCGTMIALFYMLMSITNQASITKFYGSGTIKTILSFGVWIGGIFSVCVIFYTNSFLMKQRKKELGLYSVLGMEKRHIGKILFNEILVVGCASLVGGLFGGILLSKLMFLVLLNLLHLSTGLQFGISMSAVIITCALFISMFLSIVVYNNIRLKFLNPIELLKGSNVGEIEPKTKWISAVLGVACLFVGYYLALTTQNAIQAFNVFFVAVIFVIIGTYLLFMSGSIALLKLLKRNKNYYYHKTHFITISGMIYRMKQNAVGLANICILSTAVLVVLSSTVSLYIGIDDVMRTRYPRDVMSDYIHDPESEVENNLSIAEKRNLIAKTMQVHASKHGVTIKNIQEYYSLTSLVGFNEGTVTSQDGSKTLSMLFAMTLEEYHSLKQENEPLAGLNENSIYFFSSIPKHTSLKQIEFNNHIFEIEPSSQSINLPDNMLRELVGSVQYLFVVVPDMDALIELRNIVNEMNLEIKNTGSRTIRYQYEYDLEGDFSAKEAFCNTLRDTLNNAGIPRVAMLENIYTSKQELVGLYGSLFFIGIFIGTLFLLTTVLIIYYKQISEGHEDRNRFVIMQKVGMSKDEVKLVIKNQILTVFYLPILLAVVHIAFAFDIIRKILAVLNLTNVTLFVYCTIASIFIFVIIYGIVYKLTAKSYYKLVNS